jgi:HK97 family phage portal protein
VPLDTDPAIVRAPSADATFGEWVYMLIVSAMLRGNTYGIITRRDSMGYPVQVDWQNPDQVQPQVVNGVKSYLIHGRTIMPEDMAHFRAFRMPGLDVGLSPIKFAATAINREAAIQAFSYGYFADAPSPKAVITSTEPIDAQQAEVLKKRILARLVGREPLVLGAGATYKPLSVSPEESQFLATQKLGVAEICRVFGVPPEMVAAEAGNSMTYSNVEQRGIDFLTYSIQPWLTKIENFISAMLPGGQHVRFDPSALLRTDIKSQMEATAIGIASKQVTPDEARAMRDMPPLTAAQKAILELVPLTVSPSGRPTVQPLGSALPIAQLEPGTQPAVVPPTGAPA